MRRLVGAAVAVLLVACGTKDEPQSPQAACPPEGRALKAELLAEGDKHARAYKEAQDALASDHTAGSGDSVRAKQAASAVVRQLAVLAEQEPDCFSLRERTQYETAERQLRWLFSRL